MAIIPLDYKLSWYDPSQPGGVVTTQNDNVNTATTAATQYTMADIINTVSATGGSIDGSGAQYAIPVFTDTNTITNLPIGSSGQVLVSNGAGSDPSFQAAPPPNVTLNFFGEIFSVAGPNMPIFALDEGQFKGYDIPNNTSSTYVQADTLDQGFNQLTSLIEPAIWANFPTDFVFVAGSHSGTVTEQPYTFYPTYFNPFYNSDGQWSGQSWFGKIILATPTYTYNTYMTPRGWTPNLANTFATDTRLHGVVYCANGVVTFFDKRAVEFDGTSLSDGSEWWCNTRQVQVDAGGGQNYIEVVAFFGGNTADVTLVA